jgi:hypothetical protein
MDRQSDLDYPDRSQAEAVWTVRGPCWHASTAHRWPRARVCPDSRGPWPPVRCSKRAADRPTLRNNESRAADRKQHGPCWLRGLVRLTVVFAHRIAAAFAARATLRRGAGKQRAESAGTWITESCAHACHRSSHRVESLAVLLRQRAKTSLLGADEHIAVIATHTARQRTFKF